jgi:hypothetical protein
MKMKMKESLLKALSIIISSIKVTQEKLYLLIPCFIKKKRNKEIKGEYIYYIFLLIFIICLIFFFFIFFILKL